MRSSIIYIDISRLTRHIDHRVTQPTEQYPLEKTKTVRVNLRNILRGCSQTIARNPVTQLLYRVRSIQQPTIEFLSQKMCFFYVKNYIVCQICQNLGI